MTPGTTAKIILAMLLWAACFPLISTGLNYSPHLTFATLRAALAGLSLILLATMLRRPLPRGRRIWATLAVVGFGATTLGFLGMFHAAEFVTPGLATVIANTQPLMAAMLAGLVLKERLPTFGWIGLSAGFAGILVIALPKFVVGGDYAIGVAYIIMAACGVTLSNVAIKSIARDVDALFAMGLQLLIGAAPLAVASLVLEDPTAIQWTPTFVASLLALALFGSALVYWLWFSALETVSLSRANAFSFLVPVFGLTIGILLFNERLRWIQLSGIGLVILGIIIVSSNRDVAGDGE